MLLSIIIANYNYGRFLEDAIESVLLQMDAIRDDEVELIVVDGSSTDNSVEIIKKYEDRIAWWCSEKDNGQSDAFNKGFAQAKGKYLTWLNADDVFMPGALRRIVAELGAHPDCAWFTGNFLRFTEDGRVVEIGYGPHWLPSFLQRKNAPLVVFGPSSFFSKEIFDRVGGIDVSYHYAMDTDLWLKFQTEGIRQRRINTLCWAFRMHAASKTAEFGEHKLDEKTAAKLKGEVERSYARLGYNVSRPLHLLMYVFRILDGSFLRRFWLRKTLTRFHLREGVR